MLKPAVQTTVQDLGRRGSRHLGVGRCGAMDPAALMIGNALVGNAVDAAALELCLPPASIRFDVECLMALSGAQCRARLDGAAIDTGRSVLAKAGAQLELSAAPDGARAYLCVAGGIDVPIVMGSRSTDLQTGLGGFEGRILRRGDVLRVLPPAGNARPTVCSAPYPAAGPIRVLAGPEFDEFEPQARTAFLQSSWRVTPQSNRMGFRLAGPELRRSVRDELKSHAVFPGLIQVPPGGAPIVLMADAHATGGYPRIATVIAADQGRLAQVPPGGSVQFTLCTRAAALSAWQKLLAFVHAMRSEPDAH
ncbi:MAG TPA: biotin-dependent carboxyltransferase family protein [Steroidobacteraceae bacterium]|nr:biotin-dependent carboxyltransferase family protein [Steroidobacteraceae bacterium]